MSSRDPTIGWPRTEPRPRSTKTDYFAGKLKWAPSERFDMEVRVSWTEPNDAPSNEIHLTQASRDACTNITLPNGQPYIDGTFDCELRTDNVPRNTDLTVDGGYTPGTQEYNIALANSVLDPTSQVTRERFQAEFNFPREDGSLLQVITSYNEEAGYRWHDQDQGNAPVSVNVGMNSVGMTTQNSGGQAVPGRNLLRCSLGLTGGWFVALARWCFLLRLHPQRQFLPSVRGDPASGTRSGQPGQWRQPVPAQPPAVRREHRHRAVRQRHL